MVSVILDGENCWEHYREDGNPFLEALYGTLEAAPDIRTRTPSDVLADGRSPGTLARLHSGSWIGADFHIWIGHPEKNRAWEGVARARQALVDAGATPERAPAAWQSLYRAEGSDWFWWFGDDHYTPDRPVFDRLFRELLAAAYTGAGLGPPASLRLPIVRVREGAGREAVPIGFITPTIDGRRTTFYEWHEAGRIAPAGGGSMHRAAGMVREVQYGFDAERFYLRLDWGSAASPGEGFDLGLELVEPRPLRLRVVGLAPGAREVRIGVAGADSGPVRGAECRIDGLLELAVPFAAMGVASGETVALLVQALRDGQPIESYPGEEGLTFTVPGADFEAEMWSA